VVLPVVEPAIRPCGGIGRHARLKIASFSGAGSIPAMGTVQGLFLLRKNKIFNKSRYARNRQTTRVAFYLAILINILVIFVVFILYYKVLLKFSLI
jgi:hypothetical protein